MILTLKFWRVFGVIAYIWRDLGLPPLIFENRYLSHFQRNAVILVKTDKIGYKQELAPHPDKQKGRWSKFSTTFSLSVIFVYQVGSSPSGAAGYRLYSATRRRVGRCCRASVWAQHKSLGYSW